MEDFEFNDEEIITPKRQAPKTAWKKGQSGNPAGRPKGSKNKTTEQIRNLIQEVISGQLVNFDKDLDSMNDFNRWAIIDKLAKYFMPTLTKAEVNGDINTVSEIVIKREYKKPEVNNED